MALDAGLPGPHVFVFRLLGKLNRATLQAAVDVMISQHEALRTQILQRGKPKAWQQISVVGAKTSLEVVTFQPPSGLYDVDDTEAGSMPAWIEEAVSSLQQRQIPINQAPLAAINLFEVCMIEWP